MPESVNISFGTMEEAFNALTPDPDGLLVQLTYFDDPDGPDYEFDGLLQVKLYPFVITQSFTYRITELIEFYESLRAFHTGQGQEVRFTNLLETFAIIIRPAIDGLCPVCLELDIPQAAVSPLPISGFVIARLEFISLMRRVRQSLQDCV